MWIIPKNHPLYSVFAPEYVGSKEELKELSGHLESRLMWKSKPSPVGTWLLRWNRVFWIQLLFGRMLKPSHHNIFEAKYMESLADIHANPSATQETVKVKKIHATSGRSSNSRYLQLDLFGASLKMSQGILPSDSNPLDVAWKKWVTGLRREYIQRKKLVRLTDENGCLSSQWPTPTTRMQEEEIEKFQIRQRRLKDRHKGKTGNGCGPSLPVAVKMWSTPRASANENRQTKQSPSQMTGSHGRNLASDVMISSLWLPESARDWRDSGYESAAQNRNSPCLPAAVVIYGLQEETNSNTIGRPREHLNPAWVAQLMGTTLERIFFAHLVTE